MSTPISALPTAQVTLQLAMPIAVTADIHQWWLRQVSSGGIAYLGAPMTATDTTITVADNGGTVPVGAVICIDSEPMVVTAIDSNVWTVERYPAVFPFIPVPPVQEHAAQASIGQLMYSAPWDMIADLALRPWAQQIVMNLGPKSMTFGTLASGTMSVTVPTTQKAA